MPASTATQKRAACMALAYKLHGKSALEGMKNTGVIIKMANSMTEKQLRDFCESPVRK